MLPRGNHHQMTRTSRNGIETRRLGLIGFGKLARDYYVPILRRHPEVRVVAVADPLRGSREAAARAFPDARIVSDAEAVVESSLDGLLVASPPSSHLALWNRAAERALPTFVEKPFVLAGELARARPDPGGLLTVNLNRRFWPPYQRLAASLGAGRIGALRRARFQLHVPLVPWCAVTSHRRDPREGGVLADLGSQMADLASFVLEDLSGALEGSCGQDEAVLEVLRPDGASIIIDVAYGARASESIVLEGSEGVLQIRNPNLAIHQRKTGFSTGPLGLLRDAVALAPRALRRSRAMTRFTIAASLGAFLRSEAPRERVGYSEACAHVAFLERAAPLASRAQAGA
jgi:predicted dehydrogenase